MIVDFFPSFPSFVAVDFLLVTQIVFSSWEVHAVVNEGGWGGIVG